MKNLAIKLKRKFSQNGVERSGSLNRTSSSSSSSLSSTSTSHSLRTSERTNCNGNTVSTDTAESSATGTGTGTGTATGTATATGTTTTNKSSTSSTSVEGSDDIRYNKTYKKEDLLEHVASFREVAPEKRKNLFVKKLRLCCVIFDFENESASENLGKEMKRQILLELVDHVTTNKGWFSEKILHEILLMVSSNLFRSLSPSIKYDYDPDEDEPTLDPTWPHLQIVYEFLLRFIVSTEPDPKLLKRQLNGPFILNLLRIFRSEDPREREYLKTILHRIYGKFMSLRSFIRKSINNVFYIIIYEHERHNGIGELLEILGSIINGFALPLKLEHKKFLRNVLIPLHKVNRLQIFHQQLSYCITQFIDKDNQLSLIIIGGLIKFWPIQNSSKEVLLLNELEEIIEVTPLPLLKTFLIPIFNRLAKCIQNQHFQVAERALFFWNNDLIGSLTQDHKQIIFPIVVASLHQIKQIHWNTTVHSLSLNVTRMLIEIDTDLYTKIVNQYTNNKPKQTLYNQRKQKWSKIKEIAAKKNSIRKNIKR